MTPARLVLRGVGVSLVPAGQAGDRAIAVFASVEELTRGVRQTPDCPQGVQ